MADISAAELLEYEAAMTADQKAIFRQVYSAARKDRTLALILSILLGYLGVDRFYLGHYWMGALKLLTAGLFGIIWLLDLFIIMGEADNVNRRTAARIAMDIEDHTARMAEVGALQDHLALFRTNR